MRDIYRLLVLGAIVAVYLFIIYLLIVLYKLMGGMIFVMLPTIIYLTWVVIDLERE